MTIQCPAVISGQHYIIVRRHTGFTKALLAFARQKLPDDLWAGILSSIPWYFKEL